MGNPNNVQHSDMRRAISLISHHHRRDTLGLNQVLGEATDLGRVMQLVVGLLSAYEQLLPEMHSDEGMEVFYALVVRLAQEPDWTSGDAA